MPQINARDWIFQIETGADEFTEVAGLDNFSLNPGEGEETTETTTFESHGNAESQVMQRGASITLAGRYVTDASGAQDPGQAAVEALAAEVGEASLGAIRFRHVTQDEWTPWTAWVSLAEQGGGNNDKTSWGATFTRSGAAGAPVPVV